MADEHIHRYRRVRLQTTDVYRCILPGCRHYLRRAFAIGAISSCYRCGMPFELTKRNMKLDTPHCDSCYVRRKKKELEEIKEIMKKVVNQ